jgi:alcohol dehydrogenase (cytochrome c)
MKQTSADRANHLTSGRRAPSGWPTAFDAAIGKQRWQYQSDKPMIGGVAVTGGDLVFAAEITGDFLALDAKDCEVLFRYPLDGPAAGGLVSYGSSDRQYVAVFRGCGYHNQMAPEIGGGNPDYHRLRFEAVNN